MKFKGLSFQKKRRNVNQQYFKHITILCNFEIAISCQFEESSFRACKAQLSEYNAVIWSNMACCIWEEPQPPSHACLIAFI